MNLTVSGDAANQVLAMTKNNSRLARIMARQLVTAVDRKVMAAYLVTDDIAVDLLTKRIAADPNTTLLEFQRLATGKSPRRTARRAHTTVKAQAQPKSGKRVHLTAAQATAIKTRVQAILRKGSANRKQICRAVKFPSVATYNRIMGELRGDGVIVVEGKRGKAVYLLAAKAKATGKPAKKSRVNAAKKAGAAKTAKNKTAKTASSKIKTKTGAKTAKKTRTRPPLLCPYPDCQNKAAPVFGMMCKEHKDVSAAERQKYFEARRARAAAKTT